jgi:hypothetical protein
MADQDATQTNEAETKRAAEQERTGTNLAEQTDRVLNERADAERDDAAGKDPAKVTTAKEGKLASAVTAPKQDMGEHTAQKFGNDPENPQPAPGLKDVDKDALVELHMTTSDNPDPANPKVTRVHPDMVGDYLRAGWRTPSV